MGSLFSKEPTPPAPSADVTLQAIVRRWIEVDQPDLARAANALSMNGFTDLSILCWLSAGSLEGAFRVLARGDPTAAMWTLVRAVQNGKAEEIRNAAAVVAAESQVPWARTLCSRLCA